MGRHMDIYIYLIAIPHLGICVGVILVCAIVAIVLKWAALPVVVLIALLIAASCLHYFSFYQLFCNI